MHKLGRTLGEVIEGGIPPTTIRCSTAEPSHHRRRYSQVKTILLNVNITNGCGIKAERERRVSEAFVTSDEGVSIWTIAEGDGPLTVLVSNGGAGSPDYLAPLARLLLGPERRVVRWEQRGVGRSGGDPDG